MITAIVAAVLLTSQECSLPAKEVCGRMDLVYTTFCRWKKRLKEGRDVVKRPGPQKIGTLDTTQLEQDIRGLVHGRRRTAGAPALHSRYSDALSRREYARINQRIRLDITRERQNDLSHVTWHRVNTVWAMDETEYVHPDGSKNMIQQIRDLASGYRLPMLCSTEHLTGEEIAGHLDKLFCEYGAPLFIKRDNGGNQNHCAVNDVLAAYGVIPLNSPCYYAPYNGSVEKAQDDLKKVLRRRLQYMAMPPLEHFEAYADAAAHELNHKPRRRMKGYHACRIFFENKNRVSFTRTERRNIYEWIEERSAIILESEPKVDSTSIATAWRHSCVHWLTKQNLITISKNQKVLPHFLA